MKRFFLVPALGVAALALSTQAHAQQLGSSGLTPCAPSYYGRGPAAILRIAARRLRQRLPRRPEGRRAATAAGATPSAIRTSGPGSAPTRAITARFGDSSATASSSAPGSPRATRRATRATGRSTATATAVPCRARTPTAIPAERLLSGPDRYPIRTTATRAPTAAAATATAPAYPNGVNDGFEKGREDARKRRSYDPLRHEWYRDGDRDYSSEYGSEAAVRERLPPGIQGRLRPRLSRARLHPLTRRTTVETRAMSARTPAWPDVFSRSPGTSSSGRAASPALRAPTAASAASRV